jgi:hypothetical protein
MTTVTAYTPYKYGGAFEDFSGASPPPVIIAEPSFVMLKSLNQFSTATISNELFFKLIASNGTETKRLFYGAALRSTMRASRSAFETFIRIIAVISMAMIVIGAILGILIPGKFFGALFPVGLTLLFLIGIVSRFNFHRNN